MSRPRPVPDVFIPPRPREIRTQDERIEAAVDLARKILFPAGLNYTTRKLKGRDVLLAQAVLDLKARLDNAEVYE